MCRLGLLSGRVFEVERIQVLLDGETIHDAPPTVERKDLARILESERALHAGFAFETDLELPLRTVSTQLVVLAISSSGLETVLYAGSLERALRETAHNNWVGQKALTKEREAFIDWMKSSRFWRLRDRWFSVKRALGLTDEQ